MKTVASGFATMKDDLLHLGRPAGKVRPVNHPVDFASTFIFETLADYEDARARRFDRGTINYGRYGTPATFAFEDAIAQLEGAHGAVAVSSGLTAVTMAVLPFVSAGDHILVANTVYGPTRNFCSDVLSRFGVEASYFDSMAGEAIAEHFTPRTTVIVLEAPGSNTFEVPDLPAIARAARSAGIVTVIDNTWATPLLLRPLDLGIDVSLHSGTKYLSGHSDIMIGVIAANEACYDKIRRNSLSFGERASPAEIFLALRGLRTLGMRLDRHGRSSMEVARWLQAQPRVRRILHPAFESCTGHENWKRDFKGSAGVFSFLMDPCGKDALSDFIDNLNCFGIGLSWGGYESLALPVDIDASRTNPPWKEEGQLVRLSIGLEEPSLLIGDLEAAFARLERNHPQ